MKWYVVIVLCSYVLSYAQEIPSLASLCAKTVVLQKSKNLYEQAAAIVPSECKDLLRKTMINVCIKPHIQPSLFNKVNQYVLNVHDRLVGGLIWADKNEIISSSRDGTLCWWYTNYDSSVVCWHEAFDALAFDTEKECLAAGSVVGSISLWFKEKEKLFPFIKRDAHKEGITGIAFCGNNRLVTGSFDESVVLWDVCGGCASKVVTYREHTGSVHALSTLSDDQNVVYSGSSDKTIKLWDLRTEKAVTTVTNSDVINLLTSLPQGDCVSYGPNEGTKLWDVRMNKSRGIIHKGLGIQDMTTCARSQRIALGSVDGTISIVDLDVPTMDIVIKPLHVSNDEKAVTALCSSPDGKFIAGALLDGTIRTWSLEAFHNAENLSYEDALLVAGVYAEDD